MRRNQILLSGILLCVVALCTLSRYTGSSGYYDHNTLSKIPILHEGRIKPLQSFAIVMQKQLSGTENNAMELLMRILFDPAQSEQDPILLVPQHEIRTMLGLSEALGNLYSYRDISKALTLKQDVVLSILKTPEDQWTRGQFSLIELQRNMVMLGSLLNSISFGLPLNISLPDPVPDVLKPCAIEPVTYLKMQSCIAGLDERVNQIIQDKGRAIDEYNEQEQALVYALFALNNLQDQGQKPPILRVVSPDWNTPWHTVLQGNSGGDMFALLWQNLALSYHGKDQKAWNIYTQKLYEKTSKKAGVTLDMHRIKAELLYHALDPFIVSLILYGLSILFLLSMIARTAPFSTFRLNIAVSCLSAGAILHLFGTILRIYILSRPPVSTLYESVLFTGLIIVLCGLVAYYRKSSASVLWLWMAAILGAFLHIYGLSHTKGGDSFLMLSAVLDTNFWLATHVVCITAGYAFCLMTSFLAHFTLWDMKTKYLKIPNSIHFRRTHTFALIALLLCATGTILGGIWADQSWGRFWGWDPKENGALLIVLWFVWILHGRISGQLKSIWVLAGLGYVSVVVALSWIGVNLLGVGLHSYGFTESASWGLGTFIILQTLCLGWLVYQPKKTDAP